MRRGLVVGNWKMNGSQASIATLLTGIKQAASSLNSNVEAAVCPPFIYLAQTATALQGSTVAWGTQNVSQESAGAFTGEIAAAMLTDFQCRYVIVGHSERRALYDETDGLVAEKFIAAQNENLTPILCVGELLEERESGDTEAVIARQLDAVLDAAGVEAFNRAVVAYEPVWAIGTGKTASPEQAEAVHAFIRARVAAKDQGVADALRILYGGSVKPDNAGELFTRPNIDGGLIGGASLKADDFAAICQGWPNPA